MARIFISYRREDSDFLVSQLVNELRKHFPPEQVFQDLRSIDPGADFVEALDKALSTAAVMLAVIGKHWLSATDKQGRRRLDMPGDFVRREIAESLRRPGVGVFPLLVNGAEMPAEEELPEPLKALHRRQAFELTTSHWHHDVAQLVQTLKRAPGPGAEPRGFFRFARPKQAAQRREAEEHAAKEEAERIAAEDRAKKKRPTSHNLFRALLVALIIAGLIAFVAMRDTSKQKEGPSTAFDPADASPIWKRKACELECIKRCHTEEGYEAGPGDYSYDRCIDGCFQECPPAR